MAPLVDLSLLHSTWDSFRAEDEHHSPLLELLTDVALLLLLQPALSELLFLSAVVGAGVACLALPLPREIWSGLKEAGCERLRWSTRLNRSWAPRALLLILAAVADRRAALSVLLLLLWRAPVG